MQKWMKTIHIRVTIAPNLIIIHVRVYSVYGSRSVPGFINHSLIFISKFQLNQGT